GEHRAPARPDPGCASRRDPGRENQLLLVPVAVNRVCYHPLAALLFVWACAHPRTPQQDEMVRRGDCKELLRAADAARATDHPSIARDLAEACAPDKL